MPVDWTSHRFSGGVLALDVANTVVHRDRPQERVDRFADAFEIARFAEAASRARAAETGGRELRVADLDSARPVVIAVREATDALFRNAAVSGELRPALLAPLLRAAADAMERGPEGANPSAPPSGLPPIAPSQGEKLQTPLRFEAALGFSALSLVPPAMHRRVRVCPNCAWLFLDRSRNGSRTWCDMAVCGNRQKARRHHRKQRAEEGHHA